MFFEFDVEPGTLSSCETNQIKKKKYYFQVAAVTSGKKTYRSLIGTYTALRCDHISFFPCVMAV